MEKCNIHYFYLAMYVLKMLSADSYHNLKRSLLIGMIYDRMMTSSTLIKTPLYQCLQCLVHYHGHIHHAETSRMTKKHHRTRSSVALDDSAWLALDPRPAWVLCLLCILECFGDGSTLGIVADFLPSISDFACFDIKLVIDHKYRKIFITSFHHVRKNI